MNMPDTSVSARAFQRGFCLTGGARVALRHCGGHIFDVEVSAP